MTYWKTWLVIGLAAIVHLFGQVSIWANGTLQFSSSTYSVNENAGSVTLTVTRTGGSSGMAGISYDWNDQTATEGSDYTIIEPLGWSEWNDGESGSKTWSVGIVNDSNVEGNETFTVTLTHANGGGLGSPSVATVTIVNDDSASTPGTLQFSASSASVSENGGSVTLTVTRSGGSSGAASVNYATANGSASAGTDYTSKSGTLNWSDGNSASKTFTVSITDDSSDEGGETFTVNLSGASGASLGSPSSATVTITDNESPSPDTDGAGTIILTGGSLAGQNLGTSAWEINVSAGATISGTVNCRTMNRMGANAVAPFGYTWTWGNRQTDIVEIDGWISTGTQTWQVAFSQTAPTTPGTYYILFGFSGEFNMSQVLSCDNWYAGGSVVWNDGNDYFDLDAARIQFAQINGYVQDWPYRTGASTYTASDIPVMPIKVTVTSGSSAKRYALLVGINEYLSSSYTNLHGPVNDANGVKEKMLMNDPEGRWDESNITLLTDNIATLANIRSSLTNDYANIAHAGDLVLYFHSSHGEIFGLVTYDGEYKAAYLAEDLAGFNSGANIIVIIDACYAGGVLRNTSGEALPAWSFPESVMAHFRKIKEAEFRSKGMSVPKTYGPNVAFMTACNSSQKAADGTPYSRYSGYLINGCNNLSADTNSDNEYQFSELHNYAADRVKSKQAAQTLNAALLSNTIARAVSSTTGSLIIKIMANWLKGPVTIENGTPMSVSVEMDAGDYAGVPVDWWVVALAGSSWFYMDSAVGWTQFDGNLSNCHPVYQGALGNLLPTEVLNITGLPAGSYTFWFAVDDPMDGILNVDGTILVDSVNVVVQ